MPSTEGAGHFGYKLYIMSYVLMISKLIQKQIPNRVDKSIYF